MARWNPHAATSRHHKNRAVAARVSAQMARQQHRFPRFAIRPAQPNDFQAMARMANKVFQHEHDVDYFDKHRSVKMVPADEASAIEALLEKDREWRYVNLRANARLEGRHFVVATCMREPAGFLAASRRPKEVILGWAEWQDPWTHRGAAPAKPAGSSKSVYVGMAGTDSEGEALPDNAFDTVSNGPTFMDGKTRMFIPSNGLAVSVVDTLKSFTCAGMDQPDEWDRWSSEYIPMCLGPDGDVNGKHLGMSLTPPTSHPPNLLPPVLRSLVIKSTHWDDGIGRQLLAWGTDRAARAGWSVRAMTSAASASTREAFCDAGFVETARLGVFRVPQIVMNWRAPTTAAPQREGAKGEAGMAVGWCAAEVGEGRREGAEQ